MTIPEKPESAATPLEITPPTESKPPAKLLSSEEENEAGKGGTASRVTDACGGIPPASLA